MSQVNKGGRSGGAKNSPGSRGSVNTGRINTSPGSGTGRSPGRPTATSSRPLRNPVGPPPGPGRPPHSPGDPRTHMNGYNRPPRRRRGGLGAGLLALVVIVVLLAFFYWMQSRSENDAAAGIPASATTLASGEQQGPPDTESPAEPSAPVPSNTAPLPVTDDPLEVQVLDVGQGLSVLLTCGEETMLYDGGDRATSSFVVAYLKNRGIETLDYVVVSHYDSDHLAGIIGVLNVFDVETLIAPDYTADTKLFTSFTQAVQDHDLTVTSPVPGETYAFGTGEFQVLSPLSTEYENENDYSVVLRVSLGNNSLLLTGDATQVSEAEMLESGVNLRSNVLLAGHHGSAGSTGEAFWEAVSPDYVVISCGKDNSYGHPAGRVMELFETNSVTLYRTDLQGTVHFTMTPQDIYFEQEPCNDYTSGSELYGYHSRPGTFPGRLFSSLLLPHTAFVKYKPDLISLACNITI